MTVAREAFVLPALFLSVALLGGLRIAQAGGATRLIPPSLMAMVLGLLLVGCLVRARALAPERLMNGSRSPLENLSGLVVLLALFAACAQVFNLLTPESGLLFLLFSLFFLVQLLTTLAAVRERIPLLQALAVLLGSVFLIRFVALEALYSPEGGMLKRVLTTLVEGITLGAIEYRAYSPATGYVAFLTLALFVAGLILLPAGEDVEGSVRRRTELMPAENRLEIPGSTLVVFVLAAWLPACSAPVQPVTAAVSPDAATAREQALASARVWRRPSVPISQARLGVNPPDGWQAADDVRCRFVFDQVGGTTPKFDCELPDGEIIKVKYGRANEEIYTEVAATRLLAALGFGSDRMYLVRSVRCSGCPANPFLTLQCARRTGLSAPCLVAGFKVGAEAVFRHVAVERRQAARRIEAFDGQGWAWYELDAIDPARGGASRAEVDALRLLAVFLAHWDNKSANQRLVCLPEGERADGSCAAPFALVHDLGATFGPTKIDLNNWRRVPVWADAATCRVSMKRLPWQGATFPDRQISEGGRRMLLGLLEQLSTSQLVELFTASRMTSFDAVDSASRSAGNWVRAFQDKVRQVREVGPCPARPLPTSTAGR